MRYLKTYSQLLNEQNKEDDKEENQGFKKVMNTWVKTVDTPDYKYQFNIYRSNDGNKYILKRGVKPKNGITSPPAKEIGKFDKLLKAMKTANEEIEGFVNEISSQMRDNVINTMKNKGQNKRAEKWTDHYISKELAGFENTPIMDGKFIIYGFDLEETKNGKKLSISYGSPRKQQNNKETGSIGYYINEDEYTINYEIDKKTARTLSKIAQKLNPDTKYKQTSTFKIKDR